MNTLSTEKILSSGQTMQLEKGDITAETTEAIVNASNEHLAHSGGAAGAIAQGGGLVIQSESDEWVKKHDETPLTAFR